MKKGILEMNKIYAIVNCGNSGMPGIYKIYTTKELAEEDLRRNFFNNKLYGYEIREALLCQSENELRTETPKALDVYCDIKLKMENNDIHHDFCIFSSGIEESEELDKIHRLNIRDCEYDTFFKRIAIFFTYIFPYAEVEDNMTNEEKCQYIENKIKERFEQENTFANLNTMIKNIERITMSNINNGVTVYLDTDNCEAKYGYLASVLFDTIVRSFQKRFKEQFIDFWHKHTETHKKQKRIINRISAYLKAYELGTLDDLTPCFRFYSEHGTLP